MPDKFSTTRGLREGLGFELLQLQYSADFENESMMLAAEALYAELLY